MGGAWPHRESHGGSARGLDDPQTESVRQEFKGLAWRGANNGRFFVSEYCDDPGDGMKNSSSCQEDRAGLDPEKRQCPRRLRSRYSFLAST